MTFALTTMSVPDPPERWSALGFAVVDGVVGLAGVRIGLGAPALTVTIEGVSAIEGLGWKTPRAMRLGRPPSRHPRIRTGRSGSTTWSRSRRTSTPQLGRWSARGSR